VKQSHNFPIHWGSKGFSLNVDIRGKHVVLCYGYPQESMYKQSLYTDFSSIKRKIENSEDLVASFRARARKIFNRMATYFPSGGMHAVLESVSEL